MRDVLNDILTGIHSHARSVTGDSPRHPSASVPRVSPSITHHFGQLALLCVRTSDALFATETRMFSREGSVSSTFDRDHLERGNRLSESESEGEREALPPPLTPTESSIDIRVGVGGEGEGEGEGEELFPMVLSLSSPLTRHILTCFVLDGHQTLTHLHGAVVSELMSGNPPDSYDV
ncbi:hypothetical protein KIPB_001887 [Kipferlia bialata]|uniref:Uncharacterized protein n=1 Tax=Kipferlia bialata TaxID=797122 RepID=A0A9K3GG96_9EUKA|nr:hypothetical protein KIPB_001884 [Kipferlia bialata]GIQ80996.1 hypothetical protein KIPB_001887 [Kipferlia bialata]|eukprot:g1884.t1